MASVKVKVSTAILKKRAEIDIEANNVEEALKEITKRYSEKMNDSIFYEGGKLNKFMDIFVNGRNINLLNGLDTELRDGDRVTIFRVVSGG